jgi:hypothetical protein
MGYYGHRRRPEGSVFVIPDLPVRKNKAGQNVPAAFADANEKGGWMVEVKDPSVPVKDTKAGEVTVNLNKTEETVPDAGADVI